MAEGVFQTIKAKEVSYGMAHPLLGITEDDSVDEVLTKLINYVTKKPCPESTKSDDAILSEDINTDIAVDYTISPILSTKKGDRGNSVTIDWSKINLLDKDALIHKQIDFYSNGLMIASTSKVNHVIDFKPKDYPLQAEITAIVNTSFGNIKSTKTIELSADEEKEFSPLLQVKKEVNIQNKEIAVLNSEINKLKKLLL